MKRIATTGWSRPSYSYNLRQGKVRHRSMPVVLYLLAVSIPMCASILFVHMQVASSGSAAKANLAPNSQIKVTANQNTIKTAPAISLTDQDNKLQNDINQFVASHADHNWSVQIQGLAGDERSASYNATTTYRSASMFKLLLMYPLAQKTPIAQWPSTNIYVNGKSWSLADCAMAMLKVSDNACGTAVGNYVGWSDADEELAAIGLSNTKLNDPKGPSTTAADVNYYLEGLYNGKWFDGATRGFIIKNLDQQVLRAGIPTGCGSQCTVADKTGDLGYVRHDAGIVRYARGTYVLSIFTNGASYTDIAELAAQLQTQMTLD